MVDHAVSHAWLVAAVASAVAGMGWLALAMPVHAQQVWGRWLSPLAARALRVMGVIGLLAALGFCLVVDHASMAVLVWVMALAFSALVIGLVLSWQPRCLRLLVPWVSRAD